MNSDLFVQDRGKTSGPYTHAQLEAMRLHGVCNSFSRVSDDRKSWILLDDYLAQVEFKESNPAPANPPPPLDAVDKGRAVSTETCVNRVSRLDRSAILLPFSVFALLLLHFLTAGIYSFFWITALHGKLPKSRADDPSAAKAIGLCFVPFYDFYWLFIVYPRLCVRVNSLSRQYSLPPLVPLPLAYIYCVLILVPLAMTTAGCLVLLLPSSSPGPTSDAFLIFFLLPGLLTLVNYVIVAPILYGLIQRNINHIGKAQIAESAA